MESNTLQKSMNSCVASKFFAHTPSMCWWIVKIYEIIKKCLQKLSWFFPENFLYFGSDAIEKQHILNFNMAVILYIEVHIQIQIQIERWTLLFHMQRILLISNFGSGERHNFYYANPIPTHSASWSQFITASRDPKNSTLRLSGQIPIVFPL